MFYAMKFEPNGFGGYVVRAVRTKPYKTLEAAKRSVTKAATYKGGYVKQLGNKVPVWSNVQ